MQIRRCVLSWNRASKHNSLFLKWQHSTASCRSGLYLATGVTQPLTWELVQRISFLKVLLFLFFSPQITFWHSSCTPYTLAGEVTDQKFYVALLMTYIQFTETYTVLNKTTTSYHPIPRSTEKPWPILAFYNCELTMLSIRRWINWQRVSLSSITCG